MNNRDTRRERTMLYGILLPLGAPLTAFVLLGAVLTACDSRSVEAQALDDATDNARSYAREAALTIEGLLRSGQAPLIPEQLERLDGLHPPGDGIIFGRELRPDGTVVADIA